MKLHPATIVAAALFLSLPFAPRLVAAPKDAPADAPAVQRVPHLTLEGARAALRGAQALAHERGVGGAIAVVDGGGELVALERIDGTFGAGAEVSIGKARTAALFKKPTRVFEDIVNKGRTAMVSIEGFVPLQGGIPLVVDGHVVGGIGVSGASSAQEDEELALAGAAALTQAATRVSALDAPRWIPSAEVAAAFAAGSNLLATSELVVNASRRDAPGEAEVHERDLDVFYVLRGHAVLVTGGTLVDPQRTAGGELRGRAIRGGEERHLRAGDVLAIPAGTPHWFREVHEPLEYYVVKAG